MAHVMLIQREPLPFLFSNDQLLFVNHLFPPKLTFFFSAFVLASFPFCSSAVSDWKEGENISIALTC